MNSSFFETTSYFIDEKVNLFKFENVYKVYNDQGESIGFIQQKLGIGQKILQLFLNKGLMPFHLEIKNNNDIIEATISRGWTLFMSNITIGDAFGNQIGTIKQKLKLLKPKYQIFNNSDTLIAEINGDWKAWNFVISDASNVQIGSISKKWSGAMKEIFTSADKYNVTIDQAFGSNESKTIILAAAITIDMVLKSK